MFKHKFLILAFIVLLIQACSHESETVNSVFKLGSGLDQKAEFKLPNRIQPKQLSKEFVLGKFNYKAHNNFVKVHRRYTYKPTYLQKEVYRKFLQMSRSARKSGIKFKIISGTRSFEEQKKIWEKKWQKYSMLSEQERLDKIMQYSSMPSTSRHHWGTELDLNKLNNAYFQSGKGKKEYTWLKSNAHKFGFYQVYDAEHTQGYDLEMWHWTYLPLSAKYLDFYLKNVDYQDITGFSGSSFAQNHKVIPRYMAGISKYILEESVN